MYTVPPSMAAVMPRTSVGPNLGGTTPFHHTANEGPVRIQYKCLVPISIFPEMILLFPKQNYTVLSPSSYIHISVRDFI